MLGLSFTSCLVQCFHLTQTIRRRLQGRSSMNLCLLSIQYGILCQLKPKTSSKVSYRYLTLLGLLEKNRQKRISLDEVLTHPWICKRNQQMQEMRRKSGDLEKFILYTATDPKQLPPEYRK